MFILIALAAQFAGRGVMGQKNPPGSPGSPVRFARDIQPLLSEKCYRCHGPDSRARMADLRLDTEDGAFRDRGGARAFVPGKPNLSRAYLRIAAKDPAQRMPPPGSNLALTPAQIER